MQGRKIELSKKRMDKIYEYMDSNPEFMPKVLPTTPSEVGSQYIGAMWGGYNGGFFGGFIGGGLNDDDENDETKTSNIYVYGGGDYDDDMGGDIMIDDSSYSASTAEHSLSMMGGYIVTNEKIEKDKLDYMLSETRKNDIFGGMVDDGDNNEEMNSDNSDNNEEMNYDIGDIGVVGGVGGIGVINAIGGMIESNDISNDIFGGMNDATDDIEEDAAENNIMFAFN